MKIGELARRSGLSIHTLRYYEAIGLLPRAIRDGSGQRSYDPSILVWIEFLTRMKMAGMPIKEIILYANLLKRGSATAGQRRKLMEEQRERVRNRVAELQSCLDFIGKKIHNLIKLEKE